MAIEITHATTATAPDNPAREINKDEWNENHAFEMATAKLLGRATAGTGVAEEISLGTGLAFDGTTLEATGSAGAGHFIPGGRLTLTSGLAVTTNDVASAGTLYYTPYMHDKIVVYNGSAWEEKTFSQRSLSLTGLLTANKMYDVFLDDDATTIVLSAAWTNNNTRANALGTQDSVPVMASDHTKLWLGTVYCNVTDQLFDTFYLRGVWNAYNRINRGLYRSTGNDPHTLNNTAAREWDNGSDMRAYFTVGAVEDIVNFHASFETSGGTSGYFLECWASLNGNDSSEAIRSNTVYYQSHVAHTVDGPLLGLNHITIRESSSGGQNVPLDYGSVSGVVRG